MFDRRLARCARADLLSGLAAFLCLQLGLAVAIERWWSVLRDPYYAYRAERLARRVRTGPDRPLTVIMLGSSHVQDGLKANELETELARSLGRPVVAFNFGIPGAGPVTNLLNWTRLRAAGIRPDLLLVEVGPFLLTGRDQIPVDAHFLHADRLWLRELRALKPYHFPIAELRRDWLQSWPVPGHAHRFAILSRLIPELLPGHLRLDWARHIDDSGWQEPVHTTITPELRRHRLEQALEAFAGLVREGCMGGPSCQALRDLLDLCRNGGIPVALVWMPEARDFRGWYAPPKRAQLQAFLDRLAHEYSVRLIDAREWMSDENFSDGHHLLPDGAARFTARLGQDVLLPMLAGDHRPSHPAADRVASR
jgi:hypothetical protein